MADQRTASRTEISFTSTMVEVMQPGAVWVDEARVSHVRNKVLREEISGDIAGEAVVTFNSDFVLGPSCDPLELGNCFEGTFSAWGTVNITDEDGSWKGDFLWIEEYFADEEPFSFGRIVLTGLGGNVGTSIAADVAFPEGREGNTITFTGTVYTLGVPLYGMNTTTQLCFSENTLQLTGTFTSSRGIESSGGASGRFVTGGSTWTHRSGLFGEVILTDDRGSMTLHFVGNSQDHHASSVGWGRFIIVAGTGAYADLYGRGKAIGTVTEYTQCESGRGARLQFLGEVHFG